MFRLAMILLVLISPFAWCGEESQKTPAAAEPEVAAPANAQPPEESAAKKLPADQPSAEKPSAETPPETPPAADTPPLKPETKTTESPQEKSPLKTTSDLPWKKPTVRLPPSVKPVNSPRELLDIRGIKESEWDRTLDGQPWGVDDDEMLLKVLLHFPRFSLVEIHRWQKPIENWPQFMEQSNEKRGFIFSLRGDVKRIERHDLIEELVDRYEYEHYYRVSFLPLGQTRLCELFVRSLPSAWKVGEDVNYRFTAEALYLKRGGSEEKDVAAYFASERCAWRPTEPSSDLQVNEEQVLLSALGLDIGLLAEVKAADGRPLDEFDREPMQQTLQAMGKLTPQEWRSTNPTKVDLTQLLVKPEDQQFRFMRVEGTVRRIVKVVIDAEDAERLGYPHYYELDFFISLGKQVIKLGPDKAGAPAPVFRNDFPATLCVLELPPGLKEGEKITEQISADAVFYRVWSYKSQFMEQFNLTHQPAPLFIGSTVRKVESVKPALAPTDIFVIGLVLGSVVIFGAVLAFAGRKSSAADNAVAKELKKRVPLPDKIELPPQ